MADTLQTEIIRIMQKCADDIRANMQAQGVNASRRTSESVRVREMDGFGFQLVAGRDGDHDVDAGSFGSIKQRDTAPFPTVEIGRPAGGVPHGFYYIIKAWSKEKGLQFGSEKERATFAYFLSRKIASEGTERNRKNIDVYSSAVEDASKNILKTCSSYVSSQIRAAIGSLTISKQTNL